MVEWCSTSGGEVYYVALNIKNSKTERLVQELANVTGETMTAAVTEAVRERLERVREKTGTDLANRLIKIGKDCAAHLQEPYRSLDHAELLYDEKGLPR
jgi:antitoxin VapB